MNARLATKMPWHITKRKCQGKFLLYNAAVARYMQFFKKCRESDEYKAHKKIPSAVY